MAKPMMKYFEEHARAGSGQFAIAYALLRLSEAAEGATSALRALGDGDATPHLGAIEALGAQVEKAAQIIADSRS